LVVCDGVAAAQGLRGPHLDTGHHQAAVAVVEVVSEGAVHGLLRLVVRGALLNELGRDVVEGIEHGSEAGTHGQFSLLGVVYLAAGKDMPSAFHTSAMS
jgi:hypothetical protein